MSFDKVLLIGNGRVADDCLQIMSKKGIAVELIEIFAEKFAFSEKLCERLKVPFHHIEKKAIEDYLLKLNTRTLIISAHNSYIFPKAVCEKENLTIINLHIAYLPKYRGMHPTTWAIYNQEQYAGVTWHTVSSKIDNGGIIVQNKVKIESDDTAMKLMLRCFKRGVELFEESLDSLLDESYSTFIPENSETILYLAKDLPNNGVVSEDWDFNKTYAFLRSMDYSGANLMRLPRVRHGEKVYEITNYHKYMTGEKGDYRSESWNDDTLTISWGGYGIICTLREVADTD